MRAAELSLFGALHRLRFPSIPHLRLASLSTPNRPLHASPSHARYFKGPDNGVTEWDAMPDVFPHGLEYLHNQTGWFQQLHNRYWSPKAVYARQNGGDFDFLLEKDCALPLEDRFWDFLLGQVGFWLYLVAGLSLDIRMAVWHRAYRTAASRFVQ